MFLPNNPDLDTEALSRRARRRLEICDEPPPAWEGETAWRDSLEGRVVDFGASRLYCTPRPADYGALLGLSDEDFLGAAHRCLLGRLPTEEERQRRRTELANGREREHLLLELSAQEHCPAEPLPGLRRGLVKARLKHLPKIGRLLRWGLATLRLDELRPRLVHREQLQDARYRTLLALHREQAQRLEAMERAQVRLRFENELLDQRLARHQPPPEIGSARLPEREPKQAISGERDFYRALEARFRGDPGAITSLMGEHLPRVREVPAIQAGRTLLDLGCGRGEWLELLREANITARGVDLNLENVRVGRERGLEVRYQDALAALSESEASSLGMVSAFHLVEHLPFEALRELFALAFRALVPGGRLLLETPNPRNLIVGSCNFYLDPTHQRPIPPELLAFLAEFAGFENVQVLPLHPVGDEHHLTEDSETARRLNHYLHGPQDYALLASRPMDSARAVSAGEQVSAAGEPSVSLSRQESSS